ncbi:MAG: hypothetical protein KDA42_01950 [Planctomycetales bacterium]|nr:hypothetical protein [Planctomycetales bacterium]
MKPQGLRPHAFAAGPVHSHHHHAWLSSFSSRERHALLEEDLHARNTAFRVMISAMLSGLAMLLISLWAMSG